jgi:hypothetical protein
LDTEPREDGEDGEDGEEGERRQKTPVYSGGAKASNGQIGRKA